MNVHAIDLDEVRMAYERLPKTFDSLLMATADSDGVPHASYAAYVQNQGDYYVYISELAAHTRNIESNGRVSLLFIENEEQASHLFARERVTYQCESHEISRGSENFGHVMGLFARQFGTIIDSLRELQDFHLYRLHPLRGTYVQDIARAFAIEGKDLGQIRHINDKGHKSADRNEQNKMDRSANGQSVSR